MRIGLFFGSFNPIHTGHLIIASTMQQLAELDKLWFVISPQNPLKKRDSLLPAYDRLDLVREAIQEDDRFQACDIEFAMPKPSYTIDTLTYLSEKHPSYQFSLILGQDNLKSFKKWKNYTQILENYELAVYPRPNAPETDLENHPHVRLIEAPQIDISATLIRRMILNNQSIRYLVPEGVGTLIDSRKYYQ